MPNAFLLLAKSKCQMLKGDTMPIMIFGLQICQECEQAKQIRRSYFQPTAPLLKKGGGVNICQPLINIDQSNSIPPVNDNALGDLECKIVQVPAGLNGSSMWTCIDSKKQGHCPTQQSPQNESISIDSGTSWVTSKTT